MSNTVVEASNPTSRWFPTRVMAARIALGYALVGAVWILGSGWVLHLLVQEPGMRMLMENVKGWFFVAVTAALLGVALDRYFRVIRGSARLLQLSEQRWQFALESAGHGVWDWDVESGEVFFSANWKAMLGYGPNELAGTLEEWERRVHPEDLPRVQLEVQRHLAGETPAYESEHRLRCRDGSYKWIADRGRVMEHGAKGQPLRMLGTHTDITERRAAEAALRRWADAFEHCAHGIGMGEPGSNRVLMCNPALARMTCRTPEELAGASVLSLYHSEDHEAIERQLDEADRVGQVRYEARMVRSDGSAFPVQMDVVSVRGVDGRPMYRVATAQDISERRRAYEALRQRLELQDQLAKIVTTVPGMICSFRMRSDGSVSMPFATSEIGAIFGLGVEEVRGDFTPAMERIHREDVGHVRGSIDESARTMKPWRDTFRVRHPEKGELWVEGHWVPGLESDGSILWHGFVQDVTERKHSDAVLRESLLFRREAEKVGRIGAWKVSSETDYLYSTEGVYEILEAPPEYHPGLREGLNHFDPESIPVLREALNRALKDATPFVVETGLTTLTGKRLWVEVRGLGRLGEGEAAVVMGILQDVTERKRAEHLSHLQHDLALALAASGSLPGGLRLCLDAAIDAARLDSGGFYLTNEETGGLELQVHHGLSEAFVRSVQCRSAGSVQNRMVMTGEALFMRFSELDLELSDSERAEGLRFLAVLPLRHEGRVIGCLNVSSHAVEEIAPQLRETLETIAAKATHAIVRLKAEAALRQSEQRFRTLVESAPNGIFVQVDGRFAYVNRAAAGMWGSNDSDRLLGQLVLDRFHPQCRSEVIERMRMLSEEGRAVPPAEERCTRLDGAEFEAEVSAVPFTYDDRAGALVFFHDITGRKGLETQLRQAQKLEAIGQLAGGVAHDFNNILAAIMMHLGLLQMNPALDDETRQALKDLDAEARRAAGLTRQLLMFSRRSVLAMKPWDLNEVVVNLLKMLNRLIGEHIDLRFDGKSPLPMVEADVGLLEQVLMNLVVNARDAMPRGGRITISTRMVVIEAKVPSGIRERRPGRFVTLAVSDIGCGMEPTTLKRIFEPFYTTKEAGKGTGLGLATVHGIVAQHKGWVEVESEVGRGTTFRVFLPALSPPGVENLLPPPVESMQRGRETILLVEDDSKVRRLTAQSLRVLGYRVHEAATGQEAMVVWQTHGWEVDLVLTDMVMPEGMSGLELAEQLQSMRPGLKVIIASGYSAEIVQAGVPTGSGVFYLPKPYATKVLADTVRDCLDWRGESARGDGARS